MTGSQAFEPIFEGLKKRLAKLVDNRVLAPNAYLINGSAYLPPDALAQIKTVSVARSANYLGMLVGIPVYELPASLDKRDMEREWREGSA